jgi:signal transduction histidine kinase
MIRSIQNRILLLITLIGAAMIAAVILTRILDTQRVESMLKTAVHDNAAFLGRVVADNAKSLKNFAIDNTNWDEMAAFTRTRDSAWARDNIDISLPTFDIQISWVFDSKLSPIYKTMPGGDGAVPSFPLSARDLGYLTLKSWEYDFYVWMDTSLIAVNGGAIFSSLDEVKSVPRGYLFVGRVIKPDNIRDMEQFTNTSMQLLRVSDPGMKPADSIKPKEFKTVNFLPFRDWNGNTIALLRSEGGLEIAREFETRSQVILYILVVVLVCSLLLVALILIRMINRPLRTLTIGLATEDGEAINGLASRESEFGRIAVLMKEFFRQKRLLVVEIEERKKIEAELTRALEKAEESDRLKTAFLNNISHEIRTPMNSIVGFSELLSDPRISDAEREEFAAIIRDSSNRLLGIINDLINISTLESGQEVLKEDHFNLNDLLQGIYTQIYKDLDPAKVILNLDVALKDDHSAIISDRLKLNQILMNLLNNAVKFTLEGRIDFGYSIRKGEIEFFVRDTGIGIPPSKFENIFARFQQADDSMSRQFGGTGLGLPISKAYTELMGGRMWIRSDEGNGSEFLFTIPYKTPV